MAHRCDVAIIGGGPAGATIAGFLRKFRPELDVVIFEREVFPRDHVGESLLPRLSRLLADLGAWDKMEAADFAIKIGAKYRWGTTENLWDFNFIPGAKFQDAPRPGKFEGQRIQTAFQVDRAIYDKILLDHAKELGTRVFEDVKVRNVLAEGDRVVGLEVAPEGDLGLQTHGEAAQWTAKYYVDASGSSGLLRRTLDVPTFSPTTLRNVAIWDYWQNAQWAEHIGIGGTRIQVLSLQWGWIWFIPLGPTRTSVGLVLPADYLKLSGKRPKELYTQALDEEPNVRRLLANATCENLLQTTTDWNYISERLTGENWFLAGDSGGFADPILSAGLTLAQTGSMRIANTIIELEKGELDPDWLRQDFDVSQRAQIRNHMAFADYWYSANACFTDLKEYCSEIAKAAGLTLDAETAFQWLGTGGFAHDDLGAASNAHCRISGIRYNIDQMNGGQTEWAVERANMFRLNTDGAAEVSIGSHVPGRITKVRCLKRGQNILPLHLAYGAMRDALEREQEFQPLMERFIYEFKKTWVKAPDEQRFWIGIETLEAMVSEGWVAGTLDPAGPRLKIVATPTTFFHGWWKEGVGITAATSANYGRTVLTLDEIAAIKGGMTDEQLSERRAATTLR